MDAWHVIVACAEHACSASLTVDLHTDCRCLYNCRIVLAGNHTTVMVGWLNEMLYMLLPLLRFPAWQVYDGDTPHPQRATIRDRAQLLSEWL
jgi:hypothetical protein